MESNKTSVAAIELPTYTGLILSNVRRVAANFVRCRCNQVLFQLSEEIDEEGNSALPTFEDCFFSSCSFTDLYGDAKIVFKGKNIFYNCTFGENQKIVIDGDCEFYNTQKVNLIFDKERTYDIKSIGSLMDLGDYANHPNIPLTLRVIGGELHLPGGGLYFNLVLRATGADVYIPGTPAPAYTDSDFTNCRIQAENSLSIRCALGSTLYFDGEETSPISLDGTSYIGNEIINGKMDGTMMVTKTGLIYGATISIGNRQNMACYKNAQTVSTDASAVAYNYNGGQVTPPYPEDWEEPYKWELPKPEEGE